MKSILVRSEQKEGGGGRDEREGTAHLDLYSSMNLCVCVCVDEGYNFALFST